MAGIALVSPLSFGDTSLPRVDVTRIPAIAGAVHDWAVDNLPAGRAIPSWVDRVSGKVFASASPVAQQPTVVNDPTYGKVMRYDGTAQRHEVTGLASVLQQPVTVILVARLRGAPNSTSVLQAGAAAQYFSVGINAVGGWQFFVTAGINHPDGTASDGFHVFTAVSAGAGSLLRVDSAEVTGTQGTPAATQLRVGASGNAFFPLDLKRVAILPYAATPTERATITASLTARYL